MAGGHDAKQTLRMLIYFSFCRLFSYRALLGGRARSRAAGLSFPRKKFAFYSANRFFAPWRAGLAITLIYMLILAILGRFQPMMVLGSYIGMLASVSAFIAIGLFVSALTENQIIACSITYTLLLGLWLIGFAQGYIPNEGLKAIMGYLSVANRLGEFSMGILDFSTIVYYLSITAFFLYIITVMMEKRRQD